MDQLVLFAYEEIDPMFDPVENLCVCGDKLPCAVMSLQIAWNGVFHRVLLVRLNQPKFGGHGLIVNQ